ncbi:MAG: hypothetical protein K9I71_01300 [Ignavibacteriales bacterium]|nr:hypothetical protein [Ignavibacteriales bacterium]MCF8314724.1 hypothetical protein [Ignavibacteriales bacterium]MCF8438028.1 hypothetical protein [Ignavibacteriales bacterium]
MKKTNILFIMFILANTYFAGSIIEYFHGRSEGNSIYLVWQTGKEEGVKEYIILRGTSKENVSQIASVNAKGDNSYYEFEDKNAYKSTESFYVYQLKIVDAAGKESYSGFVSVSHNVSSVKRTWGSIKALFR